MFSATIPDIYLVNLFSSLVIALPQTKKLFPIIKIFFSKCDAVYVCERSFKCGFVIRAINFQKGRYVLRAASDVVHVTD